jgi:hypothetical protein
MAQDNTIPVPSQNEVFIDRYRRITPKWYPWMRRMFENLRTTIQTVTTVEASVATLDTNVTQVVQTTDNLKGFYGVQVNANGRITAAIKLDGTPAQSSFAVLADRFVVVHPTENNTTITAFIIGTVNGIPTVGINGNLVVDSTITTNKLVANSVTADKIAAGSISADKIVVGAVGSTQLAAGAVGPGQIAANAVTADKIAANSITATKLNVTSLSSIAANLGTVTAGLIQSADGKSRWNLTTGEFVIGEP